MRIAATLVDRSALGRPDSTSAATPAALGAAALVPKNGLKPATLVATPSAAVRSGLLRSSGAASRLPATSKSLNAGPRELNASGVAGVAWFEAATVSAPRADEASGSIAPEFVACSAIVKVGVAADDVLHERVARARLAADRDADRGRAA